MAPCNDAGVAPDSAPDGIWGCRPLEVPGSTVSVALLRDGVLSDAGTQSFPPGARRLSVQTQAGGAVASQDLSSLPPPSPSPLEFGGCKPMKTTKVAVAGRSNLSVNFDEELWIPVWVPSMCKRAAVTVMNREFGRRDLVVATAYLDFSSIQRYGSYGIMCSMWSDICFVFFYFLFD